MKTTYEDDSSAGQLPIEIMIAGIDVRDPHSADEAQAAIRQMVMDTPVYQYLISKPEALHKKARREWGRRALVGWNDESIAFRFTEFELYGAGMDAVFSLSGDRSISDERRALAATFYTGNAEAEIGTIEPAFREYGRYESLVAQAVSHKVSLLDELEAEIRIKEFCEQFPDDPHLEPLRHFEAALSGDDLAIVRARQAEDLAWMRALRDRWAPPESGPADSSTN